MFAKIALLVAKLSIFTSSVNAEILGILLRVSSVGQKIVVAVDCPFPAERRRDATVEEAAAILRKAKSTGSEVFVAIISDDDNVHSRHVRPLLDAIEANPELTLRYLRLGTHTSHIEELYRAKNI